MINYNWWTRCVTIGHYHDYHDYRLMSSIIDQQQYNVFLLYLQQIIAVHLIILSFCINFSFVLTSDWKHDNSNSNHRPINGQLYDILQAMWGKHHSIQYWDKTKHYLTVLLGWSEQIIKMSFWLTSDQWRWDWTSIQLCDGGSGVTHLTVKYA